MILCLRCQKLSPSGSQFCGSGCGAFGGGRCPEGHVTHGIRCGLCGQETAVVEAPLIGLGCLGHVLAWGIVLLVMRLAVRDGYLLSSGDRVFTFVVGRPLGSVAESAFSVLATIGIFAVMFQCFLGDRVNVLKGYGALLAFLWTGFWKVAIVLSKSLYSLVEGRPAPGKPKKKRREREERHEER